MVIALLWTTPRGSTASSTSCWMPFCERTIRGMFKVQVRGSRLRRVVRKLATIIRPGFPKQSIEHSSSFLALLRQNLNFKAFFGGIHDLESGTQAFKGIYRKNCKWDSQISSIKSSFTVVAGGTFFIYHYTRVVQNASVECLKAMNGSTNDKRGTSQRR